MLCLKTQGNGKTQGKVRVKFAMELLEACFGIVAVFRKCNAPWQVPTLQGWKTTEMASRGFFLGDIQLAGEWSFRGHMRKME